jgi:sarcosine oxidase, subunit beta
MSESYDAVVIDAGVIGAATTLGLARKVLGVLCVDRLPAAGYVCALG